MTRWAWAAILAGTAALSAPASAAAQTRAPFHIAPQPLEPALIAFAQQANVSLALPQAGVGDARTQGVDGYYTTTEALTRLLAGAGYRFEVAGDRAYRIVAAPIHAAEQTAPENVIITAARRRSSLQDLPRSISDLGEDRLDQLPARDVHGLAGQISGVLFTDVGEGRDKVYIRGVSDGALTGRAQSTVGIYLDGVRLTYAAPDPQLQLVDVARVDVLRGPQGALYGAGSIGGIVSIESNAPDASVFSGDTLLGAESTRTGGVSHNAELVVNIPLAPGKLALRYAGYDALTAGWLDNPGIGQTDTNESHRAGSRLTLQWNASANWRVRAFVTDQTIDSRDSQYLPQGSSVRAAHLMEPHDNDFLLVGSSVHGETRFGDIDSTTAWVRHEINNRFDATGDFASLGANPAAVLSMDEHNALNIIVHETRITSPADAVLPWYVGFFYSDGDTESERFLHDDAGGAYLETRADAIDEIALFGETVWRIAPRVTLTTGARLFQYDVKTNAALSEALLSLSNQSAGKLTDRGLATDLRLAYQPSAGMLFFLAASEGYRSGGFNTGAPIGVGFNGPMQPFARFTGDELWTYEAGTRLTLWNGRVALSATAFANDWRNVQTDDLIVNGLPFTGNVGDARAVGFESDLRYYATDNLTLRAHVLVNEPEINKPDPTFPAAVRGLPGAPEFTLSGAAAYEHELRIARLDAQARMELDVTHVGDSAISFGNDIYRDSYTEVDASVGLSAGDVDLMVYANNLLDSAGSTFSLANPYSADGPFVTRLRPLTIGVQVRRRF